MKRFWALILSLFLLLTAWMGRSETRAASEFKTAYEVRYQVGEDGVIHVHQKVALTNRLSNVYATRYSLNLQAGKISQVKARDGQGEIAITLEESGDQTQIGLTFNEKVVGKDETLHFTLEYEAHDLANKTGQIWNVTIPKLAEPQLIDEYRLALVIPQKFGQLAFMTPQPISQEEESGSLVYHFTKNQIAASGVSAAFGQFQIFDFVLTYHLHNPHLSAGTTEIALPPDTAYQRVFYEKIDPRPENVTVDEDGNWLARYRLGGGEKITISAMGKVKIFSQPQENFLLPSQETLAKNLLPQKFWGAAEPDEAVDAEAYWQSDPKSWSGVIQQKAAGLTTPAQVYQLVVKTLEYNYDRVKEGAPRLGAEQVLFQPDQALCMEFTDLFVALARAAGIPAREVNGYAYTTSPQLRPLSLVADILHSWPEYWDEARQAWIPVDPTWEKTTGGADYFQKLDLNHFAFVIHGQDSETPYPAGSYKADGNLTKDVQVVFGRYEGEISPVLEAEFDLPQEVFFEIRGKGKMIVKNIGPGAIYQLPVHLETKNLTLQSSPEATIPVLLPFGQEEIPLRFSSPLFQFGQGQIIAALDGQQFQHSFRLRSLLLERVLPLAGVVLILTFIFLRVKKRAKLG